MNLLGRDASKRSEDVDITLQTIGYGSSVIRSMSMTLTSYELDVVEEMNQT